jgi:hypothetical protein
MIKRNRIAHSLLLSAIAGCLYACGESTSFEVKEKADAVPQVGSLDAEAAPNRDHADDTFRAETQVDVIAVGNDESDDSSKERILIDGTESASTFSKINDVAKLTLTQATKSFAPQAATTRQVASDRSREEIQEELTLTSVMSEDAIIRNQVNRPSRSENFTQGSHGSVQETFTQNANPSGVLDLLVVVDNSGSMSQEQTNLSTKLDPLLSYVSDSDWKIAVNTTDPANGCVKTVISKGESLVSKKFRDAVTAGTSGSGNERGILQAVSGLKGECLQTPWMRPNSTVAVLIISDEDNCSRDGAECPNQPYNSDNYLYDYLSSIRTAGSNARVYGIFSPTATPCSTAGNVGKQYESIVSRTGGTSGDICQSDYTTTLAAISQNISTILRNQFVLAHAPKSAQALTVRINNVVQSSGWTITGPVLEFATPPAAGSSIQVNYDYEENFFSTVQLSTTAAMETVSVSANVTLPSWSIAADKRSITFSAPPGDGAIITVAFREYATMISELALPSTCDKSTVRVKINGQLLNSSGYSLSGSTLTFAQVPADGSSIDVRFQSEAQKILTYATSLADDDSIDASDAATGAAIQISRTSGFITIGQADHIRGRMIRLTQSRASSEQVFVRLQSLTDDTISVSDAVDTCDTSSGLILTSDLVDARLCGFAADANLIMIYETPSAPIASVDVAELIPANPTSIQFWHVEVNGALVTNYSIENGQIVFDKYIPSSAEISVSVSFLREP